MVYFDCFVDTQAKAVFHFYGDNTQCMRTGIHFVKSHQDPQTKLVSWSVACVYVYCEKP